MVWFGRKKLVGLCGDRLAERMAKWILAFQQRLADRLNAKAGRMEQGKLVVLLLGLGLAFGAYCLWLVLGSFR